MLAVNQNCSKRATVLLAVLSSSFLLVSCNKTLEVKEAKKSGQAHINNKTKFSSKVFGVKGSPRLTTAKKVRKGGGRYQVGKPYKIRGKWYHPKEDRNYNRTGVASWYGPNFHGRLTANGEIYDQYALSAAHPTMPLPSYAEVTNLATGASVVVRVNDRGPYSHGRLIDLSAKAAELLDYQNAGVAKVRVKYLGKARMDGRDERKLLASYNPPKGTKSSSTLFASFRDKRKQNQFSSPVSLASLVPQAAPLPVSRPLPTNDLNGVALDITPVENNEIFERRKLEEIQTEKRLLPTAYMPERAINRRIDEAFFVFDSN